MAKEKDCNCGNVKYLTKNDLPNIYKELSKPLPEEAIQFADTKAFKGYSSTGLGYQFCFNRLNELLVGHINIKHEIVKEVEMGKMTEVTIHMTIQIGNWISNPVKLEDGIIRVENYFEVIAQRDCYGGHSSKFYYDALKGAYTNAFKKTVAMFGVGRQAYEGTLDDDFINPDGTVSNYSIGGKKKEFKPKPESRKEEEKPKKDGKMKAGQNRTIKMMLNNIERRVKNKELDFELDKALGNFGVNNWEDLNEGEADVFIQMLSSIVKGKQ